MSVSIVQEDIICPLFHPLLSDNGIRLLMQTIKSSPLTGIELSFESTSNLAPSGAAALTHSMTWS